MQASGQSSQASHEALIEARGVSLQAGGYAILQDVSMAVHAGEIVTLIGLNGSGKTTLVRVMLGLLRPTAGSVKRRRRLRVGYAPQDVLRDATLPMSADRFLALGALGRRARRSALLEEVGAAHVQDTQLADLSGGELHRVLLARALLREPHLVVLDEPLAGVDVAGQTELYRLIGELRDRHGFGVLLVSHDLHVVMAGTDRVVCLNHHVCCTGQPETVSRHPEFVSLFGSGVAEALAVYVHHHDHRHAADGGILPEHGEGQEGEPRAAGSAAEGGG